MAKDLAVRSELWKDWKAKGLVDVDFGAMGLGPHRPEQKELCFAYFYRVWANKLTDQEYSLIEQWPNLPADILRGMNHKLDQSILEMAFFAGPPFTSYCEIYERRMGEWRKEPDGPRLFMEYGKRLAQGARFEQSSAYDESVKAPLQEPHAYLFREQLVIDWGMMRARIIKSEGKTASEICAFIKSQIDKEPLASFPAIRARFSNVEQFLYNSESEGNLDYVLRWRPRQFVKQFMSYGPCLKLLATNKF